MATIGLRLANAVLFVLSCSVAGGVISDVAASIVVPTRVPTGPPLVAAAPAASRWQDRQVILERNLFGAQVVDEALADEPPAPDEPIEESRLPYKLLGTIASDDQRIASAALESTGTRLHEVVRIGDSLSGHPQVSVERIERGRIILLNGNEREQLVLDEQVTAAAASPPPRENRRVSRRQANSGRARNTVRERLQELNEPEGPRSPAAIFSQARILPKYENGAMVGIELSKIQEGSFYEQVGLQEGDVVTSLNGVPIDNPAASKQLIEALTSAENITADIIRANGNVETISVRADQVPGWSVPQ